MIIKEVSTKSLKKCDWEGENEEFRWFNKKSGKRKGTYKIHVSNISIYCI